MAPIWGRQDPGGPHVGPVNFAIWVGLWHHGNPRFSVNGWHEYFTEIAPTHLRPQAMNRRQITMWCNSQRKYILKFSEMRASFAYSFLYQQCLRTSEQLKQWNLSMVIDGNHGPLYLSAVLIGALLLLVIENAASWTISVLVLCVLLIWYSYDNRGIDQPSSHGSSHGPACRREEFELTHQFTAYLKCWFVFKLSRISNSGCVI